MSDYRIPSGLGNSEIVEKRSRFIGHLFPACSEEEAREKIRDVKKQYHDARHNCWCYRLYTGVERFSDDGEPQGSAGMPMLEVFRKEEIYDFVCVVTRYFGGVLLGTGGLSRCYSGAAKAALINAGISVKGFWQECSIFCSYALLDRCRKELVQFGAEEIDTVYGEDVHILVRIPPEKLDGFKQQIQELSSGRVRIVEL